MGRCIHAVNGLTDIPGIGTLTVEHGEKPVAFSVLATVLCRAPLPAYADSAGQASPSLGIGLIRHFGLAHCGTFASEAESRPGV
jgi:hypothetical protein